MAVVWAMVSPAVLDVPSPVHQVTALSAQLSRDKTQSWWTAPSKGFVLLNGHVEVLEVICIHFLHPPAFIWLNWGWDHPTQTTSSGGTLMYYSSNGDSLTLLGGLLCGSCYSFKSSLHLWTSLIICLFSACSCLQWFCKVVLFSTRNHTCFLQTRQVTLKLLLVSRRLSDCPWTGLSFRRQLSLRDRKSVV